MLKVVIPLSAFHLLTTRFGVTLNHYNIYLFTCHLLIDFLALILHDLLRHHEPKHNDLLRHHEPKHILHDLLRHHEPKITKKNILKSDLVWRIQIIII